MNLNNNKIDNQITIKIIFNKNTNLDINIKKAVSIFKDISTEYNETKKHNKDLSLIFTIKKNCLGLLYEKIALLHKNIGENFQIVKKGNLYSPKLKYLYHISNPKYRNEILSNGLKCQGKGEQRLNDTPLYGKYIFLTDSDNQDDWFDSCYDDDIYKVDVKKLKINTFMKDPNYKDNEYKKFFHIITIEDISKDAIELVHKGTGESK